MFGIALTIFAVSKLFWLSAAVLLFVGMSMITQAASTNTLIQSMVPDTMRGRVMAIYAMMFMGMMPLGALENMFQRQPTPLEELLDARENMFRRPQTK